MSTSAAFSAAESNPPALLRPPRTSIGLSDLIAANRQRDALYELSEQLLRASTPQAIYDAALDAIESALECDRSSVLLFDQSGTMQFVAWHGISADYRAAVSGHIPWPIDDPNPSPIPVANVDESEPAPPTWNSSKLPKSK